jgi:capsular exopolysaccharide synthesis family protein
VSIRDWLTVVRQRWRVAVAVLVAVLAAAMVVWWRTPVQYTAQMTMYVVPTPTANPDGSFQAGQLAQQRIASYLDLIKSSRVSTEVASRVGGSEDPKQIQGSISATSSLESVVIKVGVSNVSPTQAAAVANTIGEVFSSMVSELESSDVLNGAPTLEVRLVERAAVPTESSTPGLPAVLAIGLLLGCVAGAGAAFVRNGLDKSLQSGDALEALSGVPNVAVIGRDPDTSQGRLVVRDEPTSLHAEDYRVLRANLKTIMLRHGCKSFLFTGPESGAGRTTVVLNLALAMASVGDRVLVVEADLRKPRLADLLQLERQVGLTDVLTGSVGVMQAVQAWPQVATASVIAGGSEAPVPSELLASRRLPEIFSELWRHFDIILIDAPPVSEGADAMLLAPAVDCTLLVCASRGASRSTVPATVHQLRAVSSRPLGTLLTMTPKLASQAVRPNGSLSFMPPGAAQDPADLLRSAPPNGGPLNDHRNPVEAVRTNSNGGYAPDRQG